MAARVTPQEIVEMHRLYRELGNYTAVARKMDRSSATVSKYIQMKDVPQVIRLAVENLLQDKSRG